MSEPPPSPPSSEDVAAPVAHKPASFAALLTVAAPGMGHVFLEVDGAKRTRAFVLLAATVAAVVLSCFVSFPVAVLVYAAALGLAFTDIRPPRTFADMGAALSWQIVAGAGLLLAISLLLPWYRESVGGISTAVSGRSTLSVTDWVLAVIGIGSAVLGVLNLTLGTPQRPFVSGPVGLIVAVAGVVALALVVFRLLFTPGGLALSLERSFGLLLAYASAILLAGGGAGAASSKS